MTCKTNEPVRDNRQPVKSSGFIRFGYGLDFVFMETVDRYQFELIKELILIKNDTALRW